MNSCYFVSAVYEISTITNISHVWVSGHLCMCVYIYIWYVVQNARALIDEPVGSNDILANFDDAVLEAITSAASLSSPCSNE